MLDLTCEHLTPQDLNKQVRINLIRDLPEMLRNLVHPADTILPIIEECQRDLNMGNHINIYHNIKMV